MKKFDLTKMQSLKQAILRLFQGNEKIGLHSDIPFGSEKPDGTVSFDPNLSELSQIALLDAERRKAQAYTTKMHDSMR